MVFFYLETYFLSNNHGMCLVNLTKSFEFCLSFKILQMTFKCVRPSEIPAKNILNFKMKQISFEKQIKNWQSFSCPFKRFKRSSNLVVSLSEIWSYLIDEWNHWLLVSWTINNSSILIIDLSLWVIC